MTERLITLDEIKKTPPGNIPELEDINSRLKDAEKKMGDIERAAEEAQKRIDKTSSFIMWVVGAIALGFLFLITQVSLDYFKNNQERYEKFINKTEEMKSNYYSKEELDSKLNDSKNATEVLNCLKIKGYFSMRCFK